MNFIKELLGGLGAVAAFLVMLAIQIGMFVFSIWAVATLWQHFTSDTSSQSVGQVDETRQVFVKYCVAEGNGDELREYCYCVFDDLQSQMGVDGIEELGLEYERTGIIPDEMYDSVEYCIDRIDNTRFN